MQHSKQRANVFPVSILPEEPGPVAIQSQICCICRRQTLLTTITEPQVGSCESGSNLHSLCTNPKYYL